MRIEGLISVKIHSLTYTPNKHSMNLHSASWNSPALTSSQTLDILKSMFYKCFEIMIPSGQ